MKKEQYLKIRETVRDIIKWTQWEGHVFCVGGCVRDELMGNEIKDIDMVVDLPGGGVRFAKWMHENGFTKDFPVTYPTYGTAMFKLKEFPEDELECVQTRKEKYPDPKTRNPETAFGTKEEDCLRRDLTINALYINISTGELLDITGNGVDDIKNHIIRTTTEPDIIYDDDPLRILRCIRFATRYNWDIEPKTKEGMIKNAYRLEIITPERKRDELMKMLVCKHPVDAMLLLKEIGAMPFVIPELVETFEMTQNKYHCGTVWKHTLKVMDNLFKALPEDMDKDERLVIMMAALLHDIGKIRTRTEKDGKVQFIGHEIESEKMIDPILRGLKFPNEFIRQVQFLAGQHMRIKHWKDDLSALKACKVPARIRELQYLCKTEMRFRELMLLIDADNKAHAPEFCMNNQVRLILERIEQMKQEGSALFDFSLPFDGDEIMRIKDIKQGPAVKQCQDFLWKLAFVDPLRSEDNWRNCLIGFKPRL